MQKLRRTIHHHKAAMNVHQCASCARYWTTNTINDITMLINRLCPDCIQRLPALDTIKGNLINRIIRSKVNT